MLEPVADILIRTGNFTFVEVGSAVRNLKNGGALESDYVVTPEALKFGREVLIGKLRDVCNTVLLTLQPPTQWQSNIIINLPKNGNPRKCKITEESSRMSVATKGYNRILL